MYGRRSQFGPVMTDSPILSVLTVVNWHVNSVNQQHRPHQWFFTTGLENVWQPQKCILSWKMFGNLKKCILSWKMFGNLKKMHLILENGWQPQEVHLILSLWCNSKKLYLGQQSFWQSWQKLLSGQKQPVCRISSSNQMTNVIFIHLQKCEIWNVKNLWRVGGNNTESSQKLKRNRGKEGECGLWKWMFYQHHYHQHSSGKLRSVCKSEKITAANPKTPGLQIQASLLKLPS